METRTPIDFELVKTTFYEAKIAKKGYDDVFRTFTSKHLGEIEQDVNIWIKCGNYSLISVEKVERPQIRLS